MTRPFAIVSFLLVALAPASTRVFDPAWRAPSSTASVGFEVESAGSEGAPSYRASVRGGHVRFVGTAGVSPLGYEETDTSRSLDPIVAELSALGVYRLGEGLSDRRRGLPGTLVSFDVERRFTGWVPGSPCRGAYAFARRRLCAIERAVHALADAEGRHAQSFRGALPSASQRLALALPITEAGLERSCGGRGTCRFEGKVAYPFDLYGGIFVVSAQAFVGYPAHPDAAALVLCEVERVGEMDAPDDPMPFRGAEFGEPSVPFLPGPVPVYRARTCRRAGHWGELLPRVPVGHIQEPAR